MARDKTKPAITLAKLIAKALPQIDGRMGRQDGKASDKLEILSTLGKLPLHKQEIKCQQDQQKPVHAEHDGRRKQRDQPSRH